MKRLIATVVLACLATGPALAQNRAAPSKAPSQKFDKKADKKARTLALGKKIDPKLELPDIDGKPHKTADFKGRLTVVNFWSTRCPIMRGWEPTLAAIHREYGAKGVTFLTINANAGNGELRDRDLQEGQKPYQEIRRHLEELDLPYTVLVDKANEVADYFGAKTTPDVFVFDKKGALVYRGLIDDDSQRTKGEAATRYLRDTLDALLAGKEVEPKETTPYGCTIKRVKPARRVGSQRASRGQR